MSYSAWQAMSQRLVFGVLGAWKARILDTGQATGDASELLDTLGVGLWEELGAECAATWQHIVVPPDWKTLGSISPED